MKFSPLALFLSSLLVACGPSGPGALDPTGYKSQSYELQVRSLDSSGALLPAGWHLDNFYLRKVHYPKDEKAPQFEGLVAKRASDYRTTYRLDTDGDGIFENNVEDFTYELRFKHLEHDGVIFLRTIPLSDDHADKRLKVLMSRYVEQTAGSNYELTSLDSKDVGVVERRYAAVASREGAAQLAGLEAYAAHIEVANLDQLKLDAAARKEHLQLFILHTPFIYPRWSSSKYPVLLVVGYVNQPEEFQEGLTHFYDFLRRLEIEGKSGLQLPEGWTYAGSSQTPVSESEAAAQPDAAAQLGAVAEQPDARGESAGEAGERAPESQTASPESN